jgi:hypothetical protein
MDDNHVIFIRDSHMSALRPTIHRSSLRLTCYQLYLRPTAGRARSVTDVTDE